MYQHRFDPISLAAGIILMTIGIASLSGGFALWSIRWEWAMPLLAIGAGGVLLLSGLRNRAPSGEEAEAAQPPQDDPFADPGSV